MDALKSLGKILISVTLIPNQKVQIPCDDCSQSILIAHAT